MSNLVFPVLPSFPPPDWTSDPILPAHPAATTQFLGGRTSRLRLSAVQTEGKFSAIWNAVSLARAKTFIAFWQSASLDRAFTLPPSFWDASIPIDRVDIYKGLSPTGYWLFAEPPKVEDFGGTFLEEQAISCTLKGTID